MGKVRTRILGLDDVEEKQKKKQKQKLEEKKLEKKKVTSSHPELDSGSKNEMPKQVRHENEAKQEEAPKEKKKVQKKVEAKKRGKKYTASKKLVESDKTYNLDDAIKLLKKIKYAKFDESVEIHANTTKEGLRGEVDFPHSIGKTMRVRVVDDKLLEDIESGKVEFEMLVSHPSFMPRLARFAKILGPRGLMPSPKAGTVTTKPEEVVKKFTSGSIRYKSEAKSPLLHQLIGKISYEDKKIEENVIALIQAVGKSNIQKLWIKTSMSPAISLNVESI